MRFTIRDLLWLMVAVGLAGIVWNERQKYAALESEHSETIAELNRLQGRRGGGSAKPLVKTTRP